MIDEIKHIKSGLKELKQFGIGLGVILAALMAIIFLRHENFNIYLFSLSIVFLVTALTYPKILLPLQKLWMSVSIVIATVMRTLVLTILFYGVIMPIGVCARFFGKMFLDTKCDKEALSYWIPRDSSSIEKSRWEKQF